MHIDSYEIDAASIRRKAHMQHDFARFARVMSKALVALAICLGLGSAQAVVINFDNLTYVPSDPDFDCFCDHPLTDEYLSQGLLIEDGFLSTYGYRDPVNVVSAPNFLLGGNQLRLRFVGALPTFVSMYVSAGLQDAVFLNAYGDHGLIDSKQTSGYAGPFNDTPYVPKQHVSFASELGISLITLESFYGSRVSADVDDLTFLYGSPVPEPSSLALLSAGLLLILSLRTRH